MAKLKTLATVTNPKTKITTTKKEAAPLARPMEDWEIKLMDEAKAEVAKEATGMPRLAHSNAGLEIDGRKVEGNKIKVAMIDYIFAKQFFKERYMPGKAASPVCYAYGREEASMAPHEAAPEPQHATCAGCPHNVFGTAEQGRGKRCADVRRVGVIVEVDDPDSIARAEVRALSIPPGSLKNWGLYLRSIPDITPSGNVRAVLTEIGTEPNGGAYALTFKAVGVLPPEAVQAILAKRERVVSDLMQPWPTVEPGADAPAQAQRRGLKGQ